METALRMGALWDGRIGMSICGAGASTRLEWCGYLRWALDHRCIDATVECMKGFDDGGPYSKYFSYVPFACLALAASPGLKDCQAVELSNTHSNIRKDTWPFFSSPLTAVALLSLSHLSLDTDIIRTRNRIQLLWHLSSTVWSYECGCSTACSTIAVGVHDT